MNLALWIATGLLAVIALGGGITKTVIPKAKLAAQPGGSWTANLAPAAIKALGALELLAAVGLILPAVLDIAPIMVPITAVCWILLMLGAMYTHGRLGEYKFVAVNVIYLLLAAFIAWGRFVLEPF